MMKWIIDLILLAVVLLSAYNGYKRGLINEIGAMLCLLVSLYAATMVANTVSFEVVSAVKPFAGGFIEAVIADDVPQHLGYEVDEYSISDIVANDPQKAFEVAESTFRCMGVYEATAADLAQDVMDYQAANNVGLRPAIIDVTCNTVVFAGAVALFFTIILIFLTVLGNIPNISFRLPNMEEVDELGGAIVGIMRGVLLGMLAVWVLKFMGLLIGEDTLSSTIIARLFEKIGIVSFFLGV